MRRLFCFFLILSALAVKAQNPSQPSWLSDAVFYQIYPSSYQDTDGNGIGDIAGIISRLDYIKSIGVDYNITMHIGTKDGKEYVYHTTLDDNILFIIYKHILS